MVHYGKALMRLRMEKQLSAAELSRKSGLDKNTMTKIESSEDFRNLHFGKLAQALDEIGETPESFFGELYMGEVEAGRRQVREIAAKRLAELSPENLLDVIRFIDDKIADQARIVPPRVVAPGQRMPPQMGNQPRVREYGPPPMGKISSTQESRRKAAQSRPERGVRKDEGKD